MLKVYNARSIFSLTDCSLFLSIPIATHTLHTRTTSSAVGLKPHVYLLNPYF